MNDFNINFCFRIVARDIGGTDPERMTPKNVEKYLTETFPSEGNVKIKVVSDEPILEKEYPLFAAVNRAASGTIVLLYIRNAWTNHIRI